MLPRCPQPAPCHMHGWREPAAREENTMTRSIEWRAETPPSCKRKADHSANDLGVNKRRDKYLVADRRSATRKQQGKPTKVYETPLATRATCLQEPILAPTGKGKRGLSCGAWLDQATPPHTATQPEQNRERNCMRALGADKEKRLRTSGGGAGRPSEVYHEWSLGSA